MDEVQYRSHSCRWNYRFLFGTLETIDRTNRRVVIAPILDDEGKAVAGSSEISYDYLVVAIGAVSNDFGTPGVLENCLFLEDQGQADRFRQKLLYQCLRVSRTRSVDCDSEPQVRVAIVGGGATGVELSAELYNAASSLRNYGLENFDESHLAVTLLEAGPCILPQLPGTLAGAAQSELEVLGVRVLTNTRVMAAEAGAFVTGDGTRIEADLLVWAAGVKGCSVLACLDGLETSRDGRLAVRPTLQTTFDERIFAIGDCCYCVLPGESRPVPPRAQSAHQMASTVYSNLLRITSGRSLERFVYRDHGSLVSMSRFSTVGSLMGNLVGGRMAIEGRLARFVYESLYRMHLLAVHGWIRGLALIAVGRLHKALRPRIKVH